MDPNSVITKALYDNLVSGQPGDCERSSLEVAVIRENMWATLARPRWVPHNKNPSDALTKLRGCHAKPPMSLLKTSKLLIEDENDVLEAGRQGV